MNFSLAMAERGGDCEAGILIMSGHPEPRRRRGTPRPKIDHSNRFERHVLIREVPRLRPG